MGRIVKKHVNLRIYAISCFYAGFNIFKIHQKQSTINRSFCLQCFVFSAYLFSNFSLILSTKEDKRGKFLEKETSAFIVFFLSLILINCSNPALKKFTDSVARSFAQSITTEDLQRHLRIIASDDYEGRPYESTKITTYLKNFYQQQKIKAPANFKNHYQKIPKSYIQKNIHYPATKEYIRPST